MRPQAVRRSARACGPRYTTDDVREIPIVDPEQRQVRWLALGGNGRCEPIQSSRLIALEPAEPQAAIHWPAAAQS